MISINNVDNTNINVHCYADNSDHTIAIADVVRNDELGFGLKLTLGEYSTTYMIWTPSEKTQQLWNSYMNNVMSLAEVQTEATNRSISTSGKTQDQLAKEIIEYECTQKSFPFLIIE